MSTTLLASFISFDLPQFSFSTVDMDPCPFVRIAIGNLALRSPPTPPNSHYCKFNLNNFPSQFSELPFLATENDAVDGRIHACFALKRSEFEKLAEKSTKFCRLKIEIRRRRGGGTGGVCRFINGGGKLLGCVAVQLDLKTILENLGHSNNRACVVHNGWVAVGGSGASLHLNVRAESDPRFVFRFDREPECSPQVFQVNGNVKQPVFTCKFGFRNSSSRILRCRSDRSNSSNCFTPLKSEGYQHPKERKGWSITIHDLSGSPVAAASMVTPFVPSPGTDRVSRSNPGAWLILRSGHSTWKPWGRLEAWRDGSRLGYRFDLIPEGGVDTVPLANSAVSAKTGGKLNIDVTTAPTPMTSPSSSFDLSSGTGSWSGSELGSASGSGSWAHFLYRGFVMSSTVVGDRECGGGPEVEVGVQHVACSEDAAAFVALAAAMDLSMDACRSFTRKLRKELRQSETE